VRPAWSGLLRCMMTNLISNKIFAHQYTGINFQCLATEFSVARSNRLPDALILLRYHDKIFFDLFSSSFVSENCFVSENFVSDNFLVNSCFICNRLGIEMYRIEFRYHRYLCKKSSVLSSSHASESVNSNYQFQMSVSISNV